MFSSSSKLQRQAKDKMWKKWQLCHATNFQSLMYPCFIASRILGTFPYKFNLSTFETSKQCYIQLIVFICIFCVCDLLILHGIIVSKNFGVGDITQILEVTCYYALGGFIVIVTYILTGPRIRLLQTILEISSRLPPESYQKLSRLIHIKDILGTFLVVTQSCIYYYRDSYAPLLVHVFTMYISLLICQMDMQYMNCVCVLKACFKRINDSLMHMRKLLINDESHVPRLICYTQRNQFLLIKLKTLKKQHLIISDTVQMLNEIFSLQLLATIVLTFTEITFELYSHVVRWQDGVSISLNDQARDVFFIISIAYDVIKLTLIVWACETGKNQAFELGTTVHDVLNSTSDEQIREELQLFSLQILHRENIFSTKGLNVDATLLAAMIGNITTYMLILVQFLISSHSCDRRNASNISPID